MEDNPYQVQCDVDAENHLVATKNIETGSIILQEKPLVIVPFKDQFDDGPAICLGCCSELKNLKVSCPNCKLPMCGKPECWAEGSSHALGECSFMAKVIEMKDVEDLFLDIWPAKLYPSMIAVRCCALLYDQEPWKKLVQLRSIENCGQMSTWTNELESFVKSTIAEFLKELPTACHDWATNLVRVVYIDSYKLPALEGTRSEGLRALYYMASLIERSSEANATKSFTKDGQIIIRAAVPITKGSKITLDNTSTY